MSTPRIDIIAQNGGDGEYYKYEEVADKIIESVKDYTDGWTNYPIIREAVLRILIENFPNDET